MDWQQCMLSVFNITWLSWIDIPNAGSSLQPKFTYNNKLQQTYIPHGLWPARAGLSYLSQNLRSSKSQVPGQFGASTAHLSPKIRDPWLSRAPILDRKAAAHLPFCSNNPELPTAERSVQVLDKGRLASYSTHSKHCDRWPSFVMKVALH